MRKETIRTLINIFVEFESLTAVIPLIMSVIVKLINPACNFWQTLATFLILFIILRIIALKSIRLHAEAEAAKKRGKAYK